MSQLQGCHWRLLVRVSTVGIFVPTVDIQDSQGSASMAAAISDVTAIVRNQVVGTVLFGYTKNLQNLGRVSNYPSDRLQVYCAVGDLVCDGTLVITAAHLSYSNEAGNEAPRFLASKIGT